MNNQEKIKYFCEYDFPVVTNFLIKGKLINKLEVLDLIYETINFANEQNNKNYKDNLDYIINKIIENDLLTNNKESINKFTEEEFIDLLNKISLKSSSVFNKINKNFIFLEVIEPYFYNFLLENKFSLIQFKYLENYFNKNFLNKEKKFLYLLDNIKENKKYMSAISIVENTMINLLEEYIEKNQKINFKIINKIVNLIDFNKNIELSKKIIINNHLFSKQIINNIYFKLSNDKKVFVFNDLINNLTNKTNISYFVLFGVFPYKKFLNEIVFKKNQINENMKISNFEINENNSSNILKKINDLQYFQEKEINKKINDILIIYKQLKKINDKNYQLIEKPLIDIVNGVSQEIKYFNEIQNINNYNIAIHNLLIFCNDILNEKKEELKLKSEIIKLKI